MSIILKCFPLESIQNPENFNVVIFLRNINRFRFNKCFKIINLRLILWTYRHNFKCVDEISKNIYYLMLLVNKKCLKLPLEVLEIIISKYISLWPLYQDYYSNISRLKQNIRLITRLTYINSYINIKQDIDKYAILDEYFRLEYLKNVLRFDNVCNGLTYIEPNNYINKHKHIWFYKGDNYYKICKKIATNDTKQNVVTLHFMYIDNNYMTKEQYWDICLIYLNNLNIFNIKYLPNYGIFYNDALYFCTKFIEHDSNNYNLIEYIFNKDDEYKLYKIAQQHNINNIVLNNRSNIFRKRRGIWHKKVLKLKTS